MQTDAISSRINANRPAFHVWLVAIFFLCCSMTAWWMTPRVTWFEHIGKPDFEQVIPRNFGDWVLVGSETSSATIVDPQQLDAIKELYSQTVTRTYIHLPTGRRIMLSLAYGDNQVLSKQLHRPESCYSSQGFKINKLREERIEFQNHSLPVNRMTAETGSRHEQVSYWIRIGNKVIEGPPGALNLARMNTGLQGYIADGLLFRVSEIAENEASSVLFQNMFIHDLLDTLGPNQRSLLIG